MLTQAWIAHEGLVKSLVLKHCKRYHTTWDDTMGEACLLFVKATLSHDGISSELSTWLTLKVGNGLINWTLKERKIREREQQQDMDGFHPRSRFSLQDWIAELGKDARTVVKVMLESPPEVVDTRETVRVVRREIKRFLLEAGWQEHQVLQAFREVKVSL